MVTSVFVYLLALVLCVTNPTNGTQYWYIVEVFVEVFVECGDVDQVFVVLGVEATVEEKLARSINLVCAICKLRECMLVSERCYFVLIARH